MLIIYSDVAGDLIRKDHMLQSMPNVSLALHLLNEKYSPSSFWRPYIGIKKIVMLHMIHVVVDVLPHLFSLPLYFSKEELLLLRGSPCLGRSLTQTSYFLMVVAILYSVKCLLQIRNISKLYSHLHRMIRVRK